MDLGNPIPIPSQMPVVDPEGMMRARIRAAKWGSRFFGVILSVLGLAVVVIVCLAGKKADDFGVPLLFGFLFAVLPGGLMIRSGFRDPRKDPFYKAVMETPGEIARVRIVYVTSQGALARALVVADLRSGRTYSIQVQSGLEDQFAHWVQARARQPGGGFVVPPASPSSPPTSPSPQTVES